MKRLTPKLKWKSLTLLLFLMMAFFSSNVAAQNKAVTGKVIDTKNEPVIGATVLVKGTTIGIATDAGGNFKLQVPSNGILEIKSIGYQTATIKPDFTNPMTIRITETSGQLNEVVVVGFGEEKKVSVTGAIASVGEEAFRDRPVQNAEMALQGQIPGLTIQKTSTRPGNEGLNIRLRGESSVASVEPLIIVDDVPMLNSGELSQINPADIASVTVLKDGSAAVYGVRAQDGVILITTKRGKGDRPVVSFNSNFSQNSTAVKVPWANMGQWATLYLQTSYQDRVDASGNPVQFLPQWTAANLQGMATNQPVSYTDPGGNVHQYADNNWQDALYAPAWSNMQSLSVRGGTDKTAYALSLGYSLDKSILKTAFDGQTRYNARLNYDYTISKKIKLTTGLSYDDRIVQSPRAGINAGYFDAPIFPTYNIAGNFYDDYGFRNPVASTSSGGTAITEQAFIRLNAKLTAELLPGLNLTGSAAVVNNNGSGTNYAQTYNLYNYLNTVVTSVQNPLQGITESNNKTNYQDYGLQLDYTKTIAKKHNIGLMIANTEELTDNKTVTAGRTNLLYPGLYALNTAVALNATNSGIENQIGLVSYIGRFKYNYAGKYLFEALGRRDGSSRFDPDFRWTNFYSLQAGWRISEESFMKQFTFINDLKIRATHGETGGQANLGNYDYIPTVNATGTALFGSTPTLQPTATVGLSTNLRTWERMENNNIGLDFVVLNNRFSGSFDLYQRKNIGMLIGLVYPTVLGAGAPTTNNGNLKVNGWEANLNWKDKIGQVTYNIGFNIANNNNEVTSYAGKDSWNAGVTAVRQGYPLNALWVYKTDGYFKDAADVSAYYAKFGTRSNLSGMTGNSVLRPGDLKVVDLDGDGSITATGTGQPGSGDLYYYGDNAPHYTFGINLGLQWKGFDFSTFIQGVAQQNIIRTGNAEAPFFRNYANINTTYIGQTWLPDNTDAPNPRLSFDNNRNNWNWNANDVNIQHLRYARVKSLIVGYTLPSAISQKASISRARIYFSGSDLFLWTSLRDGFDPERGTSADSSYPLFKTLSFGLDVSF
jgi:TonB-linked SusC/RagA family outer membrane protein